MKVIFDFDDVLFNSKKFKKEMFQVFEDRGYGSVSSFYEEWRTNGHPFSLLDFMTSIDPSLGENEKGYLYEEILSFCGGCINDGVFRIMNDLGKENCYIVTNGIEEFQMDKIRRSIGLGVAQKVEVVSGSKAEAVREICQEHKDEEVIFVDDKVLYLNNIHTEGCENLKTVLFNENGLENLKAEIDELRESEKMEVNKEEKRVHSEHKPSTRIFNQPPGMH
jgi:hypothetical protein